MVFTPGHGDGHHNHKMVLNVTDGSAHPEISCTAHSHAPHVDIEPHLLDVGASLPLTEGGAVLQGTLELRNPHNHAIEVRGIPVNHCQPVASPCTLMWCSSNCGHIGWWSFTQLMKHFSLRVSSDTQSPGKCESDIVIHAGQHMFSRR